MSAKFPRMVGSQVESSNLQEAIKKSEGKVREHYAHSHLDRNLTLLNEWSQEFSLADLDTEKNRTVLTTRGFHSLVALLMTATVEQVRRDVTERRAKSYRSVIDRAGLLRLESLLRSAKVCAIDTEADDKDARQATLYGVAFSTKAGDADFVPFIESDLKDIGKADVLKLLQEVCNSEIEFIGHNIKYDWLLLRRHGITIRRIGFDTMLAAHECYGDWEYFNLPYLSKRLLGNKIKSYSEVVDAEATFLELPFEEMVNHGCQDADATMQLYFLLLKDLADKGLTKQFSGDSMDRLRRFAEMEFHGIAVDEAGIRSIRLSLVEAAIRLRDEIMRTVGRVFDLDSGKELAGVLKDYVGVSRVTESKTITLPALEQLATTEPKVRPIVEYKKMRGRIAAVESISRAVINGRVFPLFTQVRTPAGLVATTKPSLFDSDVAELKVCYDDVVHEYFRETQQALDVLAHLTADPVLNSVQASRSKVDAYMCEHPLMKGLQQNELLLSLVLGYSDSKLSRTFLVDRLTVATIRHDLEKRYQGMFQWLRSFARTAQARGYAESEGRRKYIDGLRSSDVGKRGRALEYALHWLIQW